VMRWVWQVSSSAKAGDVVKALIVLLSIISAAIVGWVVEFYTEFLLVNAASLKFSQACAFYEVLTPSEKDCSHGHCLDSNHPCTNRNGRGSILSASRIYSCDYPAQCRRNGLDAPKKTPIWSLDDLDAPSNG
jgi:hypothetical protein